MFAESSKVGLFSNSVHSAYLYMFIEWQTNNKSFQSAFIFQSASAFKALLFLHERFPIPA